MDKKRIAVMLVLSAALAFTACGKSSKSGLSDSELDELAKAAEERAKAALTTTTVTAPGVDLAGIDPSNGEFNIDLTQLDPDVAYAQAFDMMLGPDNYTDMLVKARGAFSCANDGEKELFSITISNSDGSASQILEFHLKNADELDFPDDYPEQDSDITITGNFHSYKIGSYTYIELLDAEIVDN